MAKVVIIGASTAGLPAAYEMKGALGREHEVTVVSNTEHFHSAPSNPWVAVGWRRRRDISFTFRRCLEKKGIKFIAEGGAQTIDPRKNEVITGAGTVVPYDYLVIATGPKLAFEEIDGLGPERNTVSVCTVDHAEKAYEQYLKFVKDPGPVVVGAAQGASCFGPAYELSFILDADLRKRRLRKKVPITFITPEPYVGHLGLAGVGDSRLLLEHEFRERRIGWHTNSKIKRVEKDKIIVNVVDEGELTIPFKYCMIMPAFRGVDAVARVEGLCDSRGFVMVDEFQRSPKYKNINSIGACVAVAPIEATPVPTGAPKTGYMTESMVLAAVHNIEAVISGAPASTRAALNAICLIDMGATAIGFAAMPQTPPRNVTWSKKSKWVHLAKVAFESYFLRKIKKGVSERFYEKIIMSSMHIKKSKGPAF